MAITTSVAGKAASVKAKAHVRPFNLSLRLAGTKAFVCFLFLPLCTASIDGQATTDSTPPVQVTSVRQNYSSDNTMQIDRGMVATQVVNASPRQLIEAAYGVREESISGGPAWAAANRYDLSYTGGALSSGGTSAALRQVLAERFHLVLQQQSRSTPFYALTVAKTGPKLQESALPENDTGQPEAVSRLNVTEALGDISLIGHLDALAEALTSELARPVLDRTGLTGMYAIDFRWNTERATAKSLSLELQRQLGLELVPQQTELPYCVIQRIDLPAQM